MNIQSFFKTAVLTGITFLSCNWGQFAQANTPRGTSGINVGSEVVGGFQVDRAADPNVLSPDQQATSAIASATATRAIAGVNQGNRTFAFPTRNGMATVVSLPTNGDRSTTVTLRMPAADGRFSRQKFVVANPISGAELTSVFVLMDQMIQLGKKPNINDLKVMLAAYNNLVKNSSPETLVVLSRLPEFQAIRAQLESLRNNASQR